MANIALRRTNEPTASNLPAMRGRWEPSRLIENFLGWDPFREMYPTLAATPASFAPDFEVSEASDSYLITGDLPGVSESDVEISLRGNQLSISGKREQEERKETSNYFCCERSYGSFMRSFTLPQGVSQENIRADLKNGVLTVIVPKSPEMQPRKISLGASTPKGGKVGSA